MEKYLQALERVRKSGKCNMFDANCVIKILMLMNEHETAYYLFDVEKSEVDLGKYSDLLYELGKLRRTAD